MTRRSERQAAGRVDFVRSVKWIDEDFEREGFMFLALELEEIPPAPKPPAARGGQKERDADRMRRTPG